MTGRSSANGCSSSRRPAAGSQTSHGDLGISDQRSYDFLAGADRPKGPRRVGVEPHRRRQTASMRIRPLGGGNGCLSMIVVSVVASMVATVLLNLVLHLF